MKRILAFVLVLGLCLSGCQMDTSDKPQATETTNATVTTEATDTTQTTAATAPSVAPTTAPTQGTVNKEMFSDRDSNSGYDASQAVKITLNGSKASASSNAVKINGSTVKITEQATYIVTGTLDDGMLVVDAPKDAKVQLVFGGVSVTNKTYAPLLILEADKVFVTLADGTENTLIAGDSFTPIDDINIDGAVFAKTDLTFNGTGTLTITSPGGHGIVCKDDLVFTDGKYTITSASHAIDANDSVRIAGGNITADAGKDGIHAENSDDASLGFVYISGGSFKAEAEGDGISAGSTLQILDGNFDITAGGGSENGNKQNSGGYGNFGGPGGYGDFGGPGGGMGGMRPQRPGGRAVTTTTDADSTSMKGLKAGTDLLISGGTFQINSADDGIHANGSLTLEKGTLTIATGDDGIHAENTLTVADGVVTITESYEGLEAQHIKVSGGDITLTASDDGLNAAGGVDQSGMGGRDDGRFMNTAFGGGFGGGPGGGFGGGNSNGSIVISGGNLNITASGDGIDANGSLEITGGYTIVTGPTQGDTSILDFDKTGTITGGTFIGTGGRGMSQNLSSSQQGVLYTQINNAAAGTQLTVTDDGGNMLISQSPALGFNLITLSSPQLQKGQTYTLTIGSQTSQVKAN